MAQLIDHKGHVQALDGLRGLAVGLVVLYHFFYREGWLPFAGAGWVGVDLFFVLSGFLITGILLDTRSRQNAYRDFLVRRVLRILPLYYAVLLVVLIIAAISRHPALSEISQHQAWFWTWTQNLYFVFVDPASLDGVLGHFWSLAIEEQFYLFWPWVVFHTSPRNLARMCMVGLAMSLTLRVLFPTFPLVYAFTPMRWDGLLLGALLAVGVREAPTVVARLAPRVLLLSSALMAVLAIKGQLSPMDPVMMGAGYTVLDLFFVSVLAMVFIKHRGASWFRTVLATKSLRKVGLYSYGIYVYHYILWYCLWPWMNVTFGAPGERPLIRALFLVLMMLLTFTISALSYEFFERRFLALKDRFAPRKITRPGAAVTASRLVALHHQE